MIVLTGATICVAVTGPAVARESVATHPGLRLFDTSPVTMRGTGYRYRQSGKPRDAEARSGQMPGPVRGQHREFAVGGAPWTFGSRPPFRPANDLDGQRAKRTTE